MSKRREQARAVFLSALMVVSVFGATVAFTGTAAAQSFDGDAGGPEDIPGGSTGVSQDLAANAVVDIDDLPDQTQGNAIKIDISSLTNAGVDISDATVDLQNSDLTVQNQPGGDEGVTVGFTTVDAEAEEIHIVLNVDDGTTSGDGPVDVDIDSLTLNNLDTSGVDTASDLDYVYRLATDNNGDFDSGFSTAAIGTSSTFGIASIEVENLNTGATVTETSLTAAIDEADGDDEFDDADDVEIRLQEGTYTTTNHAIDSGDGLLRIVAVDGATPVIDNNADPTLTINSETEIEGITFDQADNAQDAIDVGEGADLSLTDVTFQNPGASPDQYVEIRDDSGTVDIQNVTFDGDGQNNLHGIQVVDFDGGADVTIEDSTFTGLDVGINANNDLSPTTGLNSFSASNNEFSSNNVHVGDDPDNAQVDLDTIFDDNTFEKYAIVENSNGNIDDGTDHRIYGDFDQVNAGDIDSADHTTILSAGDHSLTGGGIGTVGISNNDVTITAASGTSPSNVTVDVGTTAFSLTDNNDISGLSISGITFETEGNKVVENSDGNTDSISGLTIQNNRFTQIGAVTAVVDFSTDTDDSVVDATISDNVFEPSGSSSNYEAVRLPSVSEGGSPATTEISDNVINGSGTTDAIIVGGLSGANEITLVVSDNVIRKTGSGDGIDLGGLDTGDTVDVRVQGNTITASSAGSADAIVVAASGEATTSVNNNEISDFDDANDATAIDASGFNQNGLTVENNVLTNNAEQLNFVNADPGQDPSTLLSDNTFNDLVLALDQQSGAAADNLDNSEFHGTVAAGLAEAGDSGDFVEVHAGTYDENNLAFSATGVTLGAAEGDSPTIIPVEGNANPVFKIDDSGNGGDGGDGDIIGASGVTVQDLTIDSSGINSGTIDVDVDTNGDTVTLSNNVFVGADDRTAIDAAEGGTVNVENNEISGYSTGVLINSEGTTTVDIVENQITDNSLGVDVDDGTGDANINFNDIVDNDVGLENDEADGGAEVVARGNWWGDVTGPSGEEFNGNGDEIAGGTDDHLTGTNTEPWLAESVTNLATDQYAVVTDPRNPIADAQSTDPGEPNAEVLVVVLNDTAAGNTDAASTRLLADPAGILRNIGEPGVADSSGGSGTADDPFFFNDVESEEPGDYTLTARDVDGNVKKGSAVQTFSGAPAGVNVTVDSDTLVADGSSTINATLQVVDSDGDAVSASDDSVTWLIDGASDASVSRVTEETSTDANGQARLEISAENAGVELDITGVYDPDGFSDSATVETVNQQLDVSVSPETVTANEETDVTVDVANAETGAAVEDATVDLSGPGVSQSVLTNSTGVATATVNASEAGTIDVNVSATGFDDATETITVEAPAAPPTAAVQIDDQTFTNSTDSVNVANATWAAASGEFAVAIHNNSVSANPIIGWTANLSAGVHTDVTADLDENITSNVTVQAMLHEHVGGATIDRGGSPVTDTAEITITDEPVGIGEQYDENNNGVVDTSEILTAIDDWSAGTLTTSEVLELIDLWANSTSV